MPTAPIYKICPASHWRTCQQTGRLPLSPVDAADGFIHLSAAHQVQQTAARHFRHQPDLVLLEVDPDRLPPGALRWEVSRGGDRFPHLYGDLPASAVLRATPAPLDANGIPMLSVAPDPPPPDDSALA
ncbi:DUF952 domain-containing protein [Paraliomyxa miuraensis]|uniref:DUF952 domain-containing protein n=1 Tax=Paraliomyxa miuraensis TaxID=376150 RepID=UPI00224D94FA|nr:DUF952 domain-containing protein [Paraliomyxa miuraensis]MCX4239925.1 DUF952 domain-containing protein [Paraliomyxa miuraensis]